MHDSIADAVHSVFNYGIALHERLGTGEPLHRDEEREALAQLLSAFDVAEPIALEAEEDLAFDFSASSNAGPHGQLTQTTIRYALTCWLDEWLLRHSSHAARWRERTLETELFGTDEGSTKFWEEARYAETRGDIDALEVMHLCVMLGFRGDWRETPVQLDAWATRIRAHLDQAMHTWTAPLAMEPAHLEPAYADDRAYRRMAYSMLLSLALVLPIAMAAWWLK